MSIIPTVGRKVHYFGNPAKHAEPWDATVIKIHHPAPDEQGTQPPDSPTTPVNLLVIHPDTGVAYFEPGVVVGDDGTEGRHYRWMEYQKKQAHREAFTPAVGTAQGGVESQHKAEVLPVVGQRAAFWPTADADPFDATVTHVWGPSCVNLTYTDASGIEHHPTSVAVATDGFDLPRGYYCTLVDEPAEAVAA